VPKVLIDGNLVEVPATALFNDDGATPFVPPASPAPTGRVFTEDEVAQIRQQEKDKLYGRIDTLQNNISQLTEQVGGLTAAEQRRVAEMEQEQARLEAEARRAEEQGLDPSDLIERTRSEFQQQIEQVNSTWEQKWQEAEQQRLAAEAAAAKEREFGALRDYTQQQVAARKDEIDPRFLPYITGNSREEVDAAITRAVESTNEIFAELQQAMAAQQPGGLLVPNPGQPPAPPAAPALPGTRVTVPGQDPAQQTQTLTAEQIAAMPMDKYAQLRRQMNIGNQSNDRGLFG
jgi:hypothetical protein